MIRFRKKEHRRIGIQTLCTAFGYSVAYLDQTNFRVHKLEQEVGKSEQ